MYGYSLVTRSSCWIFSRQRKETLMKKLEDYVKDGWQVQLTLSPSEEGIIYSTWTYDHPDKQMLALVGTGKSMESMLEDLQECEAEIYPELSKRKKSNEAFRKYKPLIQWDSGLPNHFV